MAHQQLSSAHTAVTSAQHAGSVPAVTVREARHGDAARVAEIYNIFVTTSTATFDTEPVTAARMARRIDALTLAGYPYLVSLRGGGCGGAAGQVLGFAYAHPWKDRPACAATWETSVYTDPAARGLHHGRALMAALIEACRQRGAHALVACITAENAESCHLHERLGFRRVSHIEQVAVKFGRTLDTADYELIL